ncbi:hypothetical protein HPULCUR_005634 [Helicostylum pulchrum]|uniref:Cytochrome c oxidase-assembly factor COX23, mitochondrial n=1 Tax=Helicostylum pulchrum TaxID=562976 RepID=A0ABP9XZM6_9FUNG
MPLYKPPTPPPKPEFDEPSTPKDFNKKFKSKESTKYMNPCALEEKESMKCLSDNNYDKRQCDYYFMQYKECKKKWQENRRTLRRAGQL